MSPEEFDALLAEHARLHVERVHARLGGPLTAENLPRFLDDSACLRWRVEIAFDDAPLDPHQFAQPVVAGPEHQRACTLYVHPRYRAFPGCLVYFIAYFAAVMNYGIAAGPDLCEEHGAALMGLPAAEFYARLCEWADFTG